MRCTRLLQTSNEPGSPCDRCRRNNRSCNIPDRKPQGRRPGAVGRYSGVEKAVRQIQNQVRKASRLSTEHNRHRLTPTNTEHELHEFLSNLETNCSPRCQETVNEFVETEDQLQDDAPSGQELALVQPHSAQNRSDLSPHRTDDSVSNPLGLLANASDEAQATEHQTDRLDPASSSATISLGNISPLDNFASIPALNPPGDLAQSMLRRPGYVSLGLKMDRDILEEALGSLCSRSGRIGRYANYFRTRNYENAQDTGPDVDPVDLGLVSMEEVWYLFPK